MIDHGGCIFSLLCDLCRHYKSLVILYTRLFQQVKGLRRCLPQEWFLCENLGRIGNVSAALHRNFSISGKSFTVNLHLCAFKFHLSLFPGSRNNYFSKQWIQLQFSVNWIVTTFSAGLCLGQIHRGERGWGVRANINVHKESKLAVQTHLENPVMFNQTTLPNNFSYQNK